MPQIKDQTAITQALLQDSKRKASLEMDYRKKGAVMGNCLFKRVL